MEIKFEFRKIHPDAKSLYRGRQGDAGYDLSAVDEVEIHPGSMAKISTGLQISAPAGYYYTLEGRSGMLNKGLITSRGIIDAGYTGEIFVLIHNHGTESYKINVGDRIAQLLPHKIIHLDFDLVEEFSSEYNTRGEAGFGSSGR